MKINKAAARKMLKRVVIGNPITRQLFKWKYERRLRRVLAENHADCTVHSTGASNAFAIRKGDNVMMFNLKDAIHGAYLAKHFDVYFSATKPIEKNGLMLVDYSIPKVHTLANGLQFEFSSFPEEPKSVDGYTAWYKPKKGDLVFDLGANAGLSVYYFAKMVGPGGRVVCFEPDPLTLGFLRKNIDRHHLENVTVVTAAVGGQDGTAQFFAEGTLGSGMANLLARESVGDVITVPVISLRTAFDRYGVPNFCKVDIEGAEIDMLEGAVERLSSVEVNFVVDTTHIVDGEFTDKRVEAIFKRAGYQSETIRNDFLTTYARPA